VMNIEERWPKCAGHGKRPWLARASIFPFMTSAKLRFRRSGGRETAANIQKTDDAALCRGAATPVLQRSHFMNPPVNPIVVGTSRCDVPARAAAAGRVAPLNAARTAQRAVPTGFRGSTREISFRASKLPALQALRTI
jgi:hypothetical protein